MYSCDNLLLSKMLKDGSYKELSLANGIANNIRTINYGNVEIDFPDGRGYIDYTYILKKNNIQYETISIKELKKLNDYTNIIILIPKEFLDYQEKINRGVTQLVIVYSAFMVKGINDNKIMLDLVENRWSNYYRELPVDYLEMLEKISTKPLGQLIKVLLIKQKSLKFTIEDIKSKIRQNAVKCLNNSEIMLENTRCISGIQFYSLMKKKIIELSQMDIKNSKNKVAIYIFASALNAGGAAFYRRDYANALVEGQYLPCKQNLFVKECFDKCIKSWEELQRIVRFLQKGDNRYVTEDKVQILLNDIEKNEIAVFETLSNEL